jgi:hypothetical protein
MKLVTVSLTAKKEVKEKVSKIKEHKALSSEKIQELIKKTVDKLNKLNLQPEDLKEISGLILNIAKKRNMSDDEKLVIAKKIIKKVNDSTISRADGPDKITLIKQELKKAGIPYSKDIKKIYDDIIKEKENYAALEKDKKNKKIVIDIWKQAFKEGEKDPKFADKTVKSQLKKKKIEVADLDKLLKALAKKYK